MRALMIAAAVLVAIAAPAAADGKMTISQSVAADFQRYQSQLGNGAGVYAVTEDGLGGGGASCANGCSASRVQKAALQQCEKANPGRSCVVFAKNQDPVVEYQVGQ